MLNISDLFLITNFHYRIFPIDIFVTTHLKPWFRERVNSHYLLLHEYTYNERHPSDMFVEHTCTLAQYHVASQWGSSISLQVLCTVWMEFESINKSLVDGLKKPALCKHVQYVFSLRPNNASFRSSYLIPKEWRNSPSFFNLTILLQIWLQISNLFFEWSQCPQHNLMKTKVNRIVVLRMLQFQILSNCSKSLKVSFRRLLQYISWIIAIILPNQSSGRLLQSIKSMLESTSLSCLWVTNPGDYFM